MKWRGVNIPGAEFAADRLPGRINFDYRYPTAEDLRDAVSLGSDIIRLPFLWERLQPSLGEKFKESELDSLRRAVSAARQLGLMVILDLHNYGSYRGNLIGTIEVPEMAFLDFWRRLAKLYARDNGVFFGLMNEPNRQSAQQWAAIAQATVLAIREEGASNWILVPGTRWSGAHSWNTYALGGSNAEAFERFYDPVDRVIFEMHQYFDADSSGTGPNCVDPEEAVARLKESEVWLSNNNRRGFLGEFGVSNRPVCLALLRALLNRLETAGVWIGWTYWASSSLFGSYMFNAYPTSRTAQGEILKEFMRGARN